MTVARSRRSRLWLSLFLLFLLVGTSTLSATDLSGQWQGSWHSDSTGHKGPLRCTLTQIDAYTYRAKFSGRFFKIIPFRYSVDLTVVSDDGQNVQLAGDQVLGRRLGTFSYSASANCTEFIANYSSCKDSGQFIMTRCCRP